MLILQRSSCRTPQHRKRRQEPIPPDSPLIPNPRALSWLHGSRWALMDDGLRPQSPGDALPADGGLNGTVVFTQGRSVVEGVGLSRSSRRTEWAA
jgi:hypothetical protein